MKEATDYTEFSYLGTDYTAQFSYDDDGLIEILSITYGDGQETDRESSHYPMIRRLAETGAQSDIDNSREA